VIAAAGTWTGPDRDYEFQWVRCDSSGASCALTAAATEQTYMLIAADVGFTLRVVVTATNKNGSTVATSEPTSVIAPALSFKSVSSTSSSTASTTTSSSTTSSTTTTSGGASLIWDGRATRMTSLWCRSTTDCGQSPAGMWDGLGFCNDDIWLESDARFGHVYHYRTGPKSGYCAGNYSSSIAYTSLNHDHYGSTLGTTEYYAESIKLLAPFTPIIAGWNSFFQWGLGPYNGPVQLTTVQACCWTPATAELVIDRNGGYYVNCVNQSGNSDYFQLYPDISALVGHWVDVIVGVHWTKDTSGWVDVYTRVPDFGETSFTLRGHLTGRPTAQWGSCNGNADDSTVDQGDQQNSYEGYWDGRSASTFPTNELQRRGYVIAPDLATAEGSFR